MKPKLSLVEFIIGGVVVIFLIFIAFVILSSTLSFYDFPNCKPSPFEDRLQVLKEVPYVYGNVRQITHNKLTIEAGFRYLNRWKCEDMRSPYKEVMGSLTKEYTVRISPETKIVTIGDPRYQFVPNNHHPEFLPEPRKILEKVDTESQWKISLDDILRDNRVVVVSQGEPALTTDIINASLIMVDPHREGLYNFGIQMTILWSAGLLIAIVITIFSQLLFYITNQGKWVIFSAVIKSLGAIAVILWYIIQIT
jgi:hypothetical protein